jgi:hypothetical protein
LIRSLHHLGSASNRVVVRLQGPQPSSCVPTLSWQAAPSAAPPATGVSKKRLATGIDEPDEELSLDVSSSLAASVPRKPDGSRVRLLSVDDDPVNQVVMQTILEPVGYEVRTRCWVGSGQPWLGWCWRAKGLPRLCVRHGDWMM